MANANTDEFSHYSGVKVVTADCIRCICGTWNSKYRVNAENAEKAYSFDRTFEA